MTVPGTDPTPADSPDATLTAAAAPAPVDTQTPPAPQVEATPTQPSPARVLIPEKRGGLAGIVDEFRDAIAGTQGRSVYIDPDTGERFVQHPTMTGKQQWLKIAGAALRGGAAGYAAGQGAGNQGQALKSGFDAQAKAQQQQDLQQDDDAQRDYQRQKEAKLAKANNQLLTTEIAKNEFALKRMQVEGTENDIKFADAQEDREKSLGSADLGVYGDHYSLADVKKLRPEFWKDHFQDDAIVAIPNFNEKGERQGVHLYLRQPGIGETPVEPGTQAYRFVPPAKPGDKPTLAPFTPTGVHTQRDFDSYNSAAFAQMQQWQTAQAEAGLKAAQTGEAKARTAAGYAEANKDNAEARQTAAMAPTDTSGNVDLSKVSASDMAIGRGIASGDLKMADVFGRMKPEQRLYYTKLAQAIDPSFTSARQPVRQKLMQDYTGNGADAVKNESFNIFLRHALDASKIVNSMRNTGSPWLNVPINELRTKAAGDPAISRAVGPILAARTEYLNFLNNNHALPVTEVEEGRRLLNENQSPAQLQAALKQMVHTGAIRLDEQNQKWFTEFGRNAPGILSPAGAEALNHFGLKDFAARLSSTGQQAPAGAGAEVYDPTGNTLIGHVVDGRFVALGAQ